MAVNQFVSNLRFLRPFQVPEHFPLPECAVRSPGYIQLLSPPGLPPRGSISDYHAGLQTSSVCKQWNCVACFSIRPGQPESKSKAQQPAPPWSKVRRHSGYEMPQTGSVVSGVQHYDHYADIGIMFMQPCKKHVGNVRSLN